MNKLIKIGLNAMVAFTMMFAATAVVAQEKVVASDNVEVKESVEADALAVTPAVLNIQSAAYEMTPAVQTTAHRYNGPDDGGNNDEWKSASNWSPGADPGECEGDGQICTIQLPVAQDLQMFLNTQSSYSSLLTHPNVTQRD